MHSTLKTVITKKILLYRFVQLYDRVLERIRFEEDHDDYISTHTFPVIDGILLEIKTQAARTYTSAVYEMLCKELVFESRHIVVRSNKDPSHTDGPTNTYWLNDCRSQDSKYFIVLYNIRQHIMYCCCAKLESIGIPCRHMFAVMKYEHMVEIPRGCILKRWTIGAKADLIESGQRADMDRNEDEKAAAGRFAFLSSLSNDLCRMASTSYDRSTWVRDKLAKMLLDTTKERATPKPVDNVQIKEGKSKKKGKKKVKEGDRIGKNKKIIAEDIDIETTLENVREAPITDANVVTEFGPGFSFVNLLRQFMPKTYCSGDASKATDCYEVSAFRNDTTVFDWDPKYHF